MLVSIGVIVLIIQLGFFKYYNFFISSVCDLIGVSYTTMQLIAPIGISFYSFSAISYIIDIYRKKYETSHSIIDVALYISFFPKLTSGPIVRPDKFISQINNKHNISLKNLEIGIQIVLIGLFKKMVLADHLSIFVADVFGCPDAFNGITCIWAMISYSLQIYFDFAGYSDIAIGLAKILGFDFDRNFDLPYLSMNPTEFWKRWHISLSSWLQEYVYYSLGGNRKGKIRTYINLLLTMLIGGLWHGANWTFIIWGAIHGCALIIHKLFMKWKENKFGSKKAGNTIWKICSTIMTFIFVTITWVFFRADSMQNALNIFARVFSSSGMSQIYSWTFLAISIGIIEIVIAMVRKYNMGMEKAQAEYKILDLTKVWNLALFFTMVGITIIFSYLGNTAFIYGKF